MTYSRCVRGSDSIEEDHKQQHVKDGAHYEPYKSIPM